MGSLTATVKAVGTLTLTGNALNTETVVIGAKTYTFQTALTNSDGNVLIGADASASIDNLIAAINLASGAGTTYAASTTRNAYVSAAAGAGDTMVVTARFAGVEGNLVTTTETLTNGSWGGATLASGSGSLTLAIEEIADSVQLNSEMIQHFDALFDVPGRQFT